MKKSPSRIWEIDCLRGIAILVMATFHLVFDLVVYWGYNLRYTEGFWYYEGKLSAIMFMMIAGVSANLSDTSFRRGLTVFSWGMVITVVTYFADPQTYIRFGILHMLGSCMMLLSFSKKVKPGWLIAVGTVAIWAGPWATHVVSKSSLLLPFGVTPAGFSSVDYYPLLPWAGVFLYGAALGQMVYKERRSLLAQPTWLRPLSALGRHSLTVYLLHQPVLLAVLYILHRFLIL